MGQGSSESIAAVMAGQR